MTTTAKRKDLTDFYDAYWFLYNHPIFDSGRLRGGDSQFEKCLDMEVVKVDPKTNSVRYKKDPVTGRDAWDKERNTATRIWLECGPWTKADELAKELQLSPGEEVPKYGAAIKHDTDLDCGGATFEEAMIKLANLVLKKYGDYKNPE